MKTVDEIRYENLQKLVDDAGGLSELVERANQKLSRPTLDQILKKRLTAGGAVKGIGDELARKIEEALRLEKGWMDNQIHANAGATVDLKGAVPPESLIELITLFTQSSTLGRELILDSARNAPKRTISDRREAAGTN